MALYEELGVDAKHLDTDDGSTRAWRLADTIYVTRHVGTMTCDHAEVIITYAELMMSRRAGKLDVFHDWLDMTGYTSDCRKRLTEWSIAHLDVYGQIHIALRSKLVAMGVQVANIALGGAINVHPDRAAVHAALCASLREAPGSMLRDT